MADIFTDLITALKSKLVFEHHFHNLGAPNPHAPLVDGEKADIYLSVQNTTPVEIKNIKGIVQKGPGADFQDVPFVIPILKAGEILPFLTIPNVVVHDVNVMKPFMDLVGKITVFEAFADFSQVKFTDMEYVFERISARPKTV